MSLPTLSIGLPVYNGEAYLPAVIQGLLDQTYTDFELIISDNASTDSTETICRDFAGRDSRINYVRVEKNRGAAWNFNNAFELGKGKYFKWTAHDDLHLPSFLEECVAILDDDESVVLAFSRTDFIDPQDHVIHEYHFPVDVNHVQTRDLFRFYTRGGHIVHEIFGVIRREALEDTPLIEGYVGSDLVLLGKLALRGRFYQVDKRLFQHREHPGRSTIATAGAQGFTHWYDSSKSGRFAAPYWRRIYENTMSVVEAPVGMELKRKCLWDILRTANWNRRELVDDLVQLLKRQWQSR